MRATRATRVTGVSCALWLAVCACVRGQSTGSASLNAPTSRSAVASSTRTAAQVTQTVVPAVDLTGAQVPYLLAEPLPARDDELRSKSAVSRMKDVFFTACPPDQVNYVDAALRLNISAVYSQFEPHSSAGTVLAAQYPYSSGVLRLVAVGATDTQARSANPQSDPPLLSTLSVETQFLTFDVFRNDSYLCDSIYPSTPDPNGTLIVPAGCLYGPGQVSLGVGIPLNDTYTLGTLWTRIRVSDTSSPPLDIACFEVYSSPYDPDKWYWRLLLWFPIALTIAYFVVIAVARIIAAASSRAKAFRNKAREGSAPNMIKDTVGPTLIAALSGQKLALSAALLRFATPGCWDVILHTQFVAALSMIAVRWPEFAYPFFKQAAWATLTGNVTLIRPASLDPQFDLLRSNANLPQGDLGTQFSNVTSPLYMNSQVPNRLLNLDGATAGMEAFAHVIGLRPKDLFGTSVSIWLLLVAAVVLVSLIAWVIDSFHDTVQQVRERREDNLATPEHKTMLDDGEAHSSPSRPGGYRFLGHTRRRRLTSSNSVIHLRMLHGNLARAVALFHLPITIFTTYEMSHADVFSATAVGLSALAFSFFSILLPSYLLYYTSRAPTAKLYDSVDTLSALGPLYNTYSPGSQLFCAVDFAHTFILGVVIGAAQASGTAQAIIVLVVEIMFALACSLWLPWGEGAMMGPVSFIANVLRIITAVLVVLLTPLVNFRREPIGWITYVILLIQAILYVCAAVLLVVKVVEGVVRLVGGASFDERASPRTSGLGGAIRKIRRRKQATPLNRSASTNTQTLMLAKSAAGTDTPRRVPAHSRQTSYASFMDPQMYGRRSPAALGDPGSAYSTYLRGEPNDEGYIMAALPSRASSPPAATPAFVRTGGGRASDFAPYQTRPRPLSSGGISPDAFPMARPRPRPLSQSAIVESYYDIHRLSMPADDPNSLTSTEAARHSSMKRYSAGGAPLRPTSSMGGMMAVDEERQGAPRPPSRGGKKPFWKKRSADADDASDDDDDDGSGPFRSQGGWRGLNKMSAAMGALAARLGGKAGVAEEGDASLEPASSDHGRTNGAFEVVRPPQRPRRSTIGTQTAPVEPPRDPLAGVLQQEPQRARPAKVDEEAFWVSRPPSQLSFTPSARPGSRARLAEPMQAELLQASSNGTTPGITPPAVPTTGFTTAIATPALSTATLDEASFFDAQGNLNSDALTFDRAPRIIPPLATPHTPEDVWDAARAYNA